MYIYICILFEIKILKLVVVGCSSLVYLATVYFYVDACYNLNLALLTILIALSY